MVGGHVLRNGISVEDLKKGKLCLKLRRLHVVWLDQQSQYRPVRYLGGRRKVLMTAIYAREGILDSTIKGLRLLLPSSLKTKVRQESRKGHAK